MKNLLLCVSLLVVGLVRAQDFDAIAKTLAQLPVSQESSIVSISAFISSHFSGDDEKIAAIYYWTTHAIRYDIPGSTNGQYDSQTEIEKVQSALTTKKGVCMHYAEVFKALALACAIPVELVSGYTKQYGKIST